MEGEEGRDEHWLKVLIRVGIDWDVKMVARCAWKDCWWIPLVRVIFIFIINYNAEL